MQEIDLNIIPKGIPDVVNVSQFDVNRELKFTLYDETQIYTIPDGAMVEIGGRKKDTTIFDYQATISSDRHSVSVLTTEQMTAIAGDNLCQIRINKDGGTIATVNFTMRVQERPDVGDIESVSDIPAIITLAREEQYNAEAWAVGTKNGIDVTSEDEQYNNHAKYWAEQAEAAAESFAGGVIYKGAITFANIPVTGQENGWMYNVTDSFTTDARFAEGAGKYCEAGTNIIWDDTLSLWDLGGGLGGVQSFNNRHGAITPVAGDYTADMTGAVDKTGDIMTGGLSILGTNSLVYEGQVPANAMAMISNADNTVSVSIAGTEVYSGSNTGHHSVYFTDYEGRMVCVPYGMGYRPGYSRAWTIKVYLPTTIADLTVNGDIVDREGNKLSDKADSKDKVDIGVIADVFDYTATYAVGDYVMYNGVLYKCTNAHTGTWADADFTETKVSDEFGSGGGTADITAIAPAFSDTTAYAVGDFVTHEGKFYKCTTAHSAGAWNSSHFTETTVDASYMAKGRDYVTAGKAANSSLGQKATAEGSGVTASGQYSHAEGDRNAATNKSAHAEGQENTAGASASHAEGYLNTISSGGLGGHAEGYKNTVSAYYAHAEGENNTVSHRGSHAEGQYNQTGATYQHVGGKYNVGKSTTLFEIGNGTANNARANAFEVSSAGDVVAAGEITDGGNNVLSDKYDATSLVFVNERFTISASGWSSTQTNGYYTYTLSTGNTKYNTYSDVTMANVGVDDSTDATSAEKAAYALVNKFDMADGTGVDSFTLYAKTKPTTTFYIKLSGRYMAKNAASSTKALDIETANPLLIGDADGNATRFNGSTYCELVYNNYLKMIPSGNWTSTVDSDGYYTNTLSVIPFNTYNGVDVRLSGSTIDTLPTAAQIAAYNLVDIFYMANGTDVRTLVVKARTKPTIDFYVTLKGSYID